MKCFKKTIVVVISLALLFSIVACATSKTDDSRLMSGLELSDGEEWADMSSYETYDAAEEYFFVKSNIKDMYEMVGRKESFVIYFGFSRCPWCRDLMPVLNYAGKESDWGKVYYADTRANKEWKSNIDMDDYDLLVEMAFDYLPYDENNIKHLDAPTVYFVKNGKIKNAVFAPQYDAHKETIPDALKKKLMSDILKGFKSLR
ncbi:MAG: hypothetical protein IJU95_01930 [Treponema sp.]|nr:hypothetical protein [Treponema sp.]